MKPRCGSVWYVFVKVSDRVLACRYAVARAYFYDFPRCCLGIVVAREMKGHC